MGNKSAERKSGEKFHDNKIATARLLADYMVEQTLVLIE